MAPPEGYDIMARNINWQFLFLVTGALGACSTSQVEHKQGPALKCPQMVAHRGGAREVGVPDNSLGAIETALSDGLDIVEVDIRWSADVKPFLFHDKRLTGAPWNIPIQLRGSSFSSVSSADLEQICTSGPLQWCLLPFSKALDSLRATTGSLQIDLKDCPNRDAVEQLVREVKNRDLETQVIFFCDPLEECALIRELTSVVRIMARVHSVGDFKQLLETPPWGVQVDEAMLTHPLLGELRRGGVFVMVKTLDETGDTREHWSSLREAGVDLILTDYPRTARAALCSE